VKGGHRRGGDLGYQRDGTGDLDPNAVAGDLDGIGSARPDVPRRAHRPLPVQGDAPRVDDREHLTRAVIVVDGDELVPAAQRDDTVARPDRERG
jgi:hypothetical protein